MLLTAFIPGLPEQCIGASVAAFICTNMISGQSMNYGWHKKPQPNPNNLQVRPIVFATQMSSRIKMQETVFQKRSISTAIPPIAAAHTAALTQLTSPGVKEPNRTRGKIFAAGTVMQTHRAKDAGQETGLERGNDMTCNWERLLCVPRMQLF